MPPEKPKYFPSFIYRIVKNHSLNKLQYITRSKRKKNMSVSLTELEECVDSRTDTESDFDEKELVSAVNDFLESLSKEKRVIFVRKYWYFDSVPVIARRCSLTEENVKVSLMRIRQKLKTFLKERGFVNES